MDTTTSIDKFRNLGLQEIELQHVEYEAGGIPMLRVRIREKARFTIFDLDPVTAEHWGGKMQEWARQQLKSQE